jgi:hypothetical protein
VNRGGLPRFREKIKRAGFSPAFFYFSHRVGFVNNLTFTIRSTTPPRTSAKRA